MKRAPETRTLVVVMLLLTVTFKPASSSGKLSIIGYYKNFSVALDPADFKNAAAETNTPLLGSVTNRLRLDLSYRTSNWISMGLAYDLLAKVQDSSLFTDPGSMISFSPAGYRLGDLDKRLYPGEGRTAASFGVFQNLDRAYVQIRTRLADFIVGRQAIAWGSSKVVNPTDILAPFTFNELDTEDRIGVDALRLRIPTGMMGELDCGYVLGKDGKFDESALFLRNKSYAAKTDIALLLMIFRENMLVGIDLARSIGGAGVWMESACVLAGALQDESTADHTDYFRSTIGCDYNLTSGIYGFIEYHFNGAGSESAGEYLDVATKEAYTEGAVYLLGIHYLAPGMIFQITPLLTVNAQVLWNLSDHSAFLSPCMEYNISSNIYLQAGTFAGIGKSPESLSGAGFVSTTRLRSEFGSIPDLYYTSFRVYF